MSSAPSAPLIVATRLRKGSANSARGAARLVADAISTTRHAGAGGLMVLRADSAYYGPDVIAAARRHRAHFSVTARKDRAVTAAIAAIAEDAWTPIRYPSAVFDEQLAQWVSDAEVAEIPFTAFTPKRQGRQVTARLIVRRVRDANPDHVARERARRVVPRLAPPRLLHRLTPADAAGRVRPPRHAIVEQVIADLKNGPLAHLPSGQFAANSAWLVLAAIAFNLTRAGRRPRLELPRQSHHRHRPRPVDQRRRPRHPLRPPARCTCPRPGPGPPPGSDCSPPRPDRQPGLNPPTAARPDRRRQWKRRADRQSTHALSTTSPTTKINYTQSPDRAVHPG